MRMYSVSDRSKKAIRRAPFRHRDVRHMPRSTAGDGRRMLLNWRMSALPATTSSIPSHRASALWSERSFANEARMP
jgi:hypothetical protein